MSGKFDNVPVEEDTKILFRLEVKIGKYDALYEHWFWDGVTAESLIFADEDIIDLSDEQLELEVKELPMFKQDSSITMKRSESGFTFVNFNFEIDW